MDPKRDFDESSDRAPLDALLARYGYHLALLTAWVATLGSLYLSDVRGFEPCALCWYQRIAMYPLAIVIAVGMLRRDAKLHCYVLPSTVIGIALATYHYLLQQRIIKHSVACSTGVPCASHYINWLGTPQRLFITIPLLALLAFVIITFATSAARRRPAAASDADDAPPWRAVAATVGAALAFIAIVMLTDGM